MTIKDVINQLKRTGYDVSFYVRKDGGIRITRINGQTFRGSSGNIQARTMVGTSLSQRRQRQLAKLTTPKGKGSYNKRRKKKLDDETIKRIQRIQRQFRKTKKEDGFPTRRNYRWVMEHKGKAEAERLLGQADLYSRGIAYESNIQHLMDRLELDMDKVDTSEQNLVQKVIDKLDSMKGILKETTLQELVDEVGWIYQWEHGTITTQQMYSEVMKILKKN